jgi:hypothetical protein
MSGAHESTLYRAVKRAFCTVAISGACALAVSSRGVLVQETATCMVAVHNGLRWLQEHAFSGDAHCVDLSPQEPIVSSPSLQERKQTTELLTVCQDILDMFPEHSGDFEWAQVTTPSHL